MDKTAEAAYVIAQSSCAMIEAVGMQVANKQRESVGKSPAYSEQDFYDLVEKYGISHNVIVSDLFRH